MVGPYSASGGAAYEVEALIAKIMNGGELSLPLDTADEETIQTMDAKDILAVRRI